MYETGDVQAYPSQGLCAFLGFGQHMCDRKLRHLSNPPGEHTFYGSLQRAVSDYLRLTEALSQGREARRCS